MKSTLALIILLVACISAQAYEMQPVNNGIPSLSMQPALQKLVGNYRVHDNSLDSSDVGDAQVRFNQYGQLEMVTTFDVIGRNCGSQIGSLQWVSGRQSQNGPVTAMFALSPGRCRIDGQLVTLSFNKTVFGSDVFRADVVIARGYNTSRGHVGSKSQQWVLQPR